MGSHMKTSKKKASGKSVDLKRIEKPDSNVLISTESRDKGQGCHKNANN